jgi:multicomponent Na+:H+ antiporter subunit D
MDPLDSLLPLAVVGVPVLTGMGIVLARRAPVVRDGVLIVGAVITFVLVARLVPMVLAGQVPTTVLGEMVPGVELTLRADGMGMVFACLASFLWVLAGFYAVGYMRGDKAKNQTRFYAFYALCLSTAFGVAFAGDLLTFFIAYELLTVTTYPLVTHKGDDKAIAAGRTYLGYLLSGGAAVLFALVIVYGATGQFAFEPGGFVGDALGPGLTILVFLLFSVGFGTKAGLLPLHAWLPGAMVAPTPVSALLHAVAVVKGGVFAFGRMIGFVMGPEALAAVNIQAVLSAVAGATIVIASVIALRQDHLKRRLAYSTIAHLAYIVLGFSLLSGGAFEGSLLHILNHGLAKITLFFAAGAIHIAAHKDHVSELDGIGRRMPFTMIAFAVAAYSLAGLPPAGGFLSKFTLVLGALEAEQYVYAGIMVGSGLFTAGYLFPVVYRAFFRPEVVPDAPAPAGPAPVGAAPGEPTAPMPADGPRVGTAVAENAPPTGHAPEAHASGVHTGTTATAADAGPVATTHAAQAHGADHHDHADHGEAAARMVVPLCITAALSLLVGLFDPAGLYSIAAEAALSVTGGGS